MNAHSPPSPINNWIISDTDKADALMIFAELIDSCEPKPFTADDWAKGEETPVEKAAASAYTATIHWMSLFERQRLDPSPNLSMMLDGAREDMWERHALHTDAIEIEAIGALDGGRWIGPGYYGQGLAIHNDGDDLPMMYIPRGLGRDNILLLLRAHDSAFAMGVRVGGNKVRDELTALLVKR